jgi:hypothetical protein
MEQTHRHIKRLRREIWKPISLNEEYSISNRGNISHNGKILKSSEDKDGYLVTIIILKSKVRKTVKIHRLVAIAFIPNLKNKKEVNHKNGIKNDPYFLNLEWSTPGENQLHSYKILKRKAPMLGKIGHYTSVSQYDTEGNFLKFFNTITEANKMYNIPKDGISACLRGKQKTAGKFCWKKEKHKKTGI